MATSTGMARPNEALKPYGLGGGFDFATLQKNLLGKVRRNGTPAPPPDLTDEVIWAAQRAEMLRQRTGRTRQSTFLTQPTSLLGG